MTANLKIAKDAVRIAMKELRHGNKQAARAWAHRAVELDPGLEDGWLILAYLSEPRASLEYIKTALAVNPGSHAARQALVEVQRRLEKVSHVAPARASHLPVSSPAAAPPPPPSPAEAAAPAPTPPKKPKSTPKGWLKMLPIYLLACVAIGILTLLVFQYRLGNAYALAPGRQESIVLLPMSTSSSSTAAQPIHPAADTAFPAVTASATPPPTATATPTVLPTDTASPTALPTDTASPTALPTETATPVPTDTASATPPATASLAEAPISNTPVQPVVEETSGEKSIVVRISDQHLYAYHGDTLVYDFVASTGAAHATRIGSFSVLDKIPNAWSDPWSFWMPDWLGIYWVGYTENGIHALPVLTDGEVLWGDALGTPVSHGCVVLSPEDARSLYDWADIGTAVEILP
jgi:lipoprotein-anchoring transpeptidase ErfK/SrfK